jgi:hypothetical protein
MCLWMILPYGVYIQRCTNISRANIAVLATSFGNGSPWRGKGFVHESSRSPQHKWTGVSCRARWSSEWSFRTVSNSYKMGTGIQNRRSVFCRLASRWTVRVPSHRRVSAWMKTGAKLWRSLLCIQGAVGLRCSDFYGTTEKCASLLQIACYVI